MELIDVTKQATYFYTGLRSYRHSPSWVMPQLTDSFYRVSTPGELEVRGLIWVDSQGSSLGERRGFQWN